MHSGLHIKFRKKRHKTTKFCVWTEHKSRKGLPWGGVERARGFEFSSKPFPEGEPPEERATTFHASIQETSTTCVVPSTE